MSSSLRIVTFSDAVEPEPSQPPAERLLSPAPRITTWNHYAEPGGHFFAGVWAATRGRWRVHYSEHEFCHLLSGRVVISAGSASGSAAQDARYEFAAGDSFVIPAGFEGIWEVLEDCRKLYAIYQSNP